jgi:hypothetical protein
MNNPDISPAQGSPLAAAHELILSPEALVFFIDDTGHERLVQDQPIYGLGGCGVMGRDLDAALNTPWREVRRLVTGSTDAPLHAAKFSRSADPEHIKEVAAFFASGRFARIGATIDTGASVLGDIDHLTIVARVLMNRIVEVARWMPFHQLAIVFEASQRANALIEAALQGIGLEADGQKVPLHCAFMPKSAGEPGLEVADFIMHAIGRQTRHTLKHPGEKSLLPDFAATFHGQDRRLVSFMHVAGAVPSKTPDATTAD